MWGTHNTRFIIHKGEAQSCCNYMLGDREREECESDPKVVQGVKQKL